MNTTGTRQEIEETGDIARLQRRDLRQEIAQVGAPAQLDTIAEGEAEGRLARREVEVIGQALVRRREEVFQQLRQGEDRRTGVEAEAVEFQRAELATRPRTPLDDRHRTPGVRQPDRRREAAEAGTDHDDAGTWGVEREAWSMNGAGHGCVPGVGGASW